MKRKLIYISGLGILLLVAFLFVIGGKKSVSATVPTLSNDKVHDQLLFESLPSETASAGLNLDIPNITLEVGKTIAEELIKQNPEGPDLLEDGSFISARDPQELIDSIIAQELGKVAPEDFRKTVSLGELTIITGTEEEKKIFAKQLHETIVPLAGLSIDTQNLSPQSFLPLVRITDQTFTSLSALSVPTAFALSFAKELELISLQRSIFAAIAGSESDPFRALIALQIWDVSREEFQNHHRAFSQMLIPYTP